MRLFVGLFGEGCLFFLGGFRVSVCADVKINTIVKFKNLYILQLYQLYDISEVYVVNFYL